MEPAIPMRGVKPNLRINTTGVDSFEVLEKGQMVKKKVRGPTRNKRNELQPMDKRIPIPRKQRR